MTKSLIALGKAVSKAAGKGVVHEAVVAHGELNVTVAREQIGPFLTLLRDDPEFRFQQLVDLTCVDYPERTQRFDVVYHLLSLVKNVRIRVKLATDEQTPVPSIIPVHPCADWFEREAFDMYGVMFQGHPDLRRLLTDYGFEGHPLRKDFPMTGYVEVRWDEQQKRVVYEPVELRQEFRQFDFLSPWEGAEYPIRPLPGDEKARGEVK
ncbi:MAG: NADH-quinone oxidoreductase subunit C [Caulobacteraceae bacterium]|nr:NADH-quinone oxidoreductase subunit C [Caulobacteraceae bacterium]